jgi:hypothetical protein
LQEIEGGFGSVLAGGGLQEAVEEVDCLPLPIHEPLQEGVLQALVLLHLVGLLEVEAVLGVGRVDLGGEGGVVVVELVEFRAGEGAHVL